MKYKTRPGVVLTTICGETYLVAAKAILQFCPYVTQINETSAFLWKLLIPGCDSDALERAVQEEYEVDDPEEVRAAIQDFVRQMLELGYLLEEQGDQDEE